jgi:hypothetical protein
MPLHDVVPAKAGTHTPCPLDWLRSMGPGALAGTTQSLMVSPTRQSATYFLISPSPVKIPRTVSFWAVMNARAWLLSR